MASDGEVSGSKENAHAPQSPKISRPAADAAAPSENDRSDGENLSAVVFESMMMMAADAPALRISDVSHGDVTSPAIILEAGIVLSEQRVIFGRSPDPDLRTSLWLPQHPVPCGCRSI